MKINLFSAVMFGRSISDSFKTYFTILPIKNIKKHTTPTEVKVYHIPEVSTFSALASMSLNKLFDGISTQHSLNTYRAIRKHTSLILCHLGSEYTYLGLIRNLDSILESYYGSLHLFHLLTCTIYMCMDHKYTYT